MNKIVWDLIKEKLEITGLSKVILDESRFIDWRTNTEPNAIVLELDVKQKPLLNIKNVSRIQDAIRAYLESDIKLFISCERETHAKYSLVTALYKIGDREPICYRAKELNEEEAYHELNKMNKMEEKNEQ